MKVRRNRAPRTNNTSVEDKSLEAIEKSDSAEVITGYAILPM
jgi:hypothetical protein